MLVSEKLERSRRFRLALRMGVPILLLIGVVLISFFRQNGFHFTEIDLIIFATILFVSIYFLFFLINASQSEIYIDRMTGAFNRDYFLSAMNKEMAKASDYAIALLRVDNLHFINDHYGIDRGDKLLGILVHVLDDFLKLQGIKEPLIGRYHGGDFLVAMPVSAKGSQTLFEEFVTTYKEIGKIALELKFSVVGKEEASDHKRLITHLYDTISQPISAKKVAKTSNRPIDLGALEKEIVEAIDARALKLHFIPSLHLQRQSVDLFEVGVRLVTQSNEILPPKKFIPIVNRLGLESQFDEALFSAVCEVASLIDPQISFSFNISPFSLRNESFAKRLPEIAVRRGVDPRRLLIELFENRPFKDLTRYRAVLEELKEHGMRFALDNFGGQNASFEYIKRLPIDMVQFDREFTIAYNNPKIAALLKGYIQACHTMNIQTLVKWVDTLEVKERFRQIGVDYIQGFIVANRPIEEMKLIEKYGVKHAIR